MIYQFENPIRNKVGKSDYSVPKKVNMVSNKGCTRILKEEDTVYRVFKQSQGGPGLAGNNTLMMEGDMDKIQIYT